METLPQVALKISRDEKVYKMRTCVEEIFWPKRTK
jgi:hypothetical protein